MPRKTMPPPWLYLLMTVVSVLFLGLYVQTIIARGASAGLVFRVIAWVIIGSVFLWAFERSRKGGGNPGAGSSAEPN